MANSGTDTTTTLAPVADPYLARLMAKAADGGWFRPSALVSMYRLGRIEARRQGITLDALFTAHGVPTPG